MRACGGCSISACRSRPPTGDDGLITGERRQLLLTISDLPDLNRVQVETVAAKDGVPLDALYGVLRALGTAKIPEDPTELEKLLDAQAGKLKTMMAERDALKTDDPEIARLTDAADRAISEGAIVTARKFLDDAVKRVEATSDTVDAAEELVKQKRLADAAIYVRRADAVVARLRLRGGRRRLRQGFRSRREMGRQAQVELQEHGGRGAERARRRDGQSRRAEARDRCLSSDPRLHPGRRKEPRLGDHQQQHGGGAWRRWASASPAPKA